MTYYELLEISENASDDVVHMAYKALVKKYHPDVYIGDKNFAEEKMKNAWREKFDQVMSKGRSLRGDAEFTQQLDYYESILEE